MATPTLHQARSHYHRQRIIAANSAVAVRRLFARKAPLTQVAATVALYQQAAATAASNSSAGWLAAGTVLTRPEAFAGVSSMGFPIIEPIIATIDKRVEAPAEAIPANWWTQADVASFITEVEQLIAAEVQDAARSATSTEMTGHDVTEYVRVLNPPSCSRCVILAGTVWKWHEAFERHPGCDCQNVPVESASAADDLITNPYQAIRAGNVRGLSQADTKAILDDGATPSAVINAHRGMYKAGYLGRTLKATTEGATKRGLWRQQNPTRPIRLRPEAIYRRVEADYADRPESFRIAEARRLLGVYGYLT